MEALDIVDVVCCLGDAGRGHVPSLVYLLGRPSSISAAALHSTGVRGQLDQA